MFLALFQPPVEATQNVTLGWDSSPDLSVTGYNAYHGVASRTYTNLINAGNGTRATIPDLVEGTTYFFAVTAYNILGLESEFSDELSYTVPEAPAMLQIRAINGQMVLIVTGPAGRSYDLLVTQDLMDWTVIGTVTVVAGGATEFPDTGATNFQARFYRLQEKP
ncbi:MAG: fibronectin type III domain-containing protein [Verrucomicrobia bacterium]|nr:fibronectin type III domain-containing protein [Verrucomicrobiota bacterium]